MVFNIRRWHKYCEQLRQRPAGFQPVHVQHRVGFTDVLTAFEKSLHKSIAMQIDVFYFLRKHCFILKL
jgi:hypothetical protein